MAVSDWFQLITLDTVNTGAEVLDRNHRNASVRVPSLYYEKETTKLNYGMWMNKDNNTCTVSLPNHLPVL